jgi:hypothetical protein
VLRRNPAEFRSPDVTRLCLVHLPDLVQRVAKIGVSCGKVWPQLRRASQRNDGIVKSTQRRLRDTNLIEYLRDIGI